MPRLAFPDFSGCDMLGNLPWFRNVSDRGKPVPRMNVADRITLQANQRPQALAIATPIGSAKAGTSRPYDRLSFEELDQRTSSIAVGLRAMGMRPGHRIAMAVPFGADFIALVFALLKTGVTLILIDPGMGRKNALRCLESTDPDGIVGIGKAQFVRWLMRSRFPKAKLNVTVGRTWGCLPHPTLADLERSRASDYRTCDRQQDDDAAIIFTTGSTGPPKGVLYSHGTFNHQIDQLVEHFEIRPGGIDLSGFPLFGLFNAVMGTSTVIPDMDPTKPADVVPEKLLDAIDQWQVNQSFGSPALWTRVGRYCEQHKRTIPSLRLVLSAGAPVAPKVLQWMRAAIHPEGKMFTPYGATEALPVASIESREVLGETAAKHRHGLGTCVGQRFSGIEWKVIAIDDGPIETIDQVRNVDRGEIGELMVSGPVISRRYVTRTDQNAFHKVVDGEKIWHRMGDVGYLDDRDRFWFCGRKSHRVRTIHGPLFTEPCEAILSDHPTVHRTALVGIGQADQQRPVAIVEPWPEKRPKNRVDSEELVKQMLALAQGNPTTTGIHDVLIYPTRLPTDIRHNAKIFRELLGPWAQKQLG